MAKAKGTYGGQPQWHCRHCGRVILPSPDHMTLLAKPRYWHWQHVGAKPKDAAPCPGAELAEPAPSARATEGGPR